MATHSLRSHPFFTTVSNNLHYIYYDMWQEIGDPRVVTYPLFGKGPWDTVSIILAYLLVVLVIGPNFMRNRKPYDLKGLVFYYNVAMVALNCYMFVEGMRITNFGIDAWGCQLTDRSNRNATEVKKLDIGFLFFLSKLIELFDTVIFVLRKKSSQISMLHVIHHSLVPFLIWIGYKIMPGGNMALFPLINSLIHTIMYGYYGLTTLGPAIQPYLWWKKYLTRIQMIQFVIVMVHSMHVMFLPSCNFPKSLLYMSIVNALLFLVLFYSFYQSTYKSNNNKKVANGSAIITPSCGPVSTNLPMKTGSFVDMCRPLSLNAHLEANNNDVSVHGGHKKRQ